MDLSRSPAFQRRWPAASYRTGCAGVQAEASAQFGLSSGEVFSVVASSKRKATPVKRWLF